MSGVSRRLDVVIKLEQELGEMDRLVIQTIQRLTLVTGAQIRRLHFETAGHGRNDAQRARRALLRLTRLGLLDRLERRIGGIKSGSEGFCYRLTGDGQRLVRWWQNDQASPERLRPEPGLRFVQHRLAVSEVYVHFIEASRHAREPDFEVLDFEAEPDSWRQFDVGLAERPRILKPDAFLKLGVGEFEHWWFCEVDLGTVGRRARESQATAYRSYWRSGGAGSIMPRVLWITPNELVRERARAAIQAPDDPHGLFVVTTLPEAISAALTMSSGEAS